MSYLALARRYRPENFDGILSQHHITTTLKNAVASGRISHAYLLCGPRGTGKTTTARVLAKALNCEKGPTPDPCGECTVCKEIAIGSSPDVFEIDAASNRGIDDIRELRENVRYSPVGGRYKIYIIDEVHRLTREAFDALLKTLEEPPSHVVFVFATTEPNALPATILSRTQRYDFKRIPVSALAEAVNSVARKEGMTIDSNAALLIARKADGSLRDALSLLDQLSSFSGSTIDVERTVEILGLIKTELLSGIAGAVIEHDTASVLEKMGEFVGSGGDPQELAEAISRYMRALLLVKNGVEDVEQIELDATELENAKQMTADLDIVDLLRYFTILADYKSLVKSGMDPVHTLETSLVKMASIDRAVSLEELFRNAPSNPQRSDPGTVTNRRSSHSSSGNEFRSNSNNTNVPGNDGIEESLPPEKFEGELDLDSISRAWPNFTRYLSGRDKTIFAYTVMCRPADFSGETLTLSLDGGAKFQYEQLSVPSKKADLEAHLQKFLSRGIKVKLVMNKENQGTSGETNMFGAERILMESPAVKKLFDLLGGEIVGQ